MALTIGELVGFINLDDSGARQGVARTEAAMDGLVRATDGRLRDMRGRFVSEGAAMGDGLGDGISTGADDGASAAEGGMLDRFGGMKAGLAALGAGLGAALGAALMAGVTEALDQSRIVGRLGAQLGATPAEAKKYGDLAGELYADAITEDFQGAADAISATMRAGLLPPDATNAQIKSIATGVTDLASTFELDLGQTANAVGQTIKTGLAKNATEALDAMTRGMQKMGPRADDMMDSFNEYSTQFRQMGLDVTDVVGLMSQGLAKGARDTDIVVDGLKEFVLIAQEGGDEATAAFERLGLSGEEMQKVFSEGGPKAREALDTVLDRIRNIKDPAERAATSVALFGTKSEDMQKALSGLDLTTAKEELGEVAGAADEMGNTLRDNAGTKIEQFKRRVTQNVVEFIGGDVIPAFEKFGSFIRENLGGIWEEAGKGADGLPDQIINALQILGEKAWEKVKELGPKLIDAVMEAGQDFADYVMANPAEVFKAAALGAAFVAAIAALPILVGGALIAAATAMIWTFVAGMISSLGEKIPEWWNSFTGWIDEKAGQAGDAFSNLGDAIGEWFSGLWAEYVADPVSRTWNSFIGGVKELPGRSIAALSDLGSRLRTRASESWQDFKDAASRKGSEIVDWATGMPGRIARGVGDLGSLLYDKGTDVARGLLNGIKSMGSWLAGELKAWAASIIPGPIADALGIRSPSRVMAELGRWIPAGLVRGIESGQGAVDRTMRALVTPPPIPAIAPALAGTGAYGPAGFGAGGGPLVHVEHWHAENGAGPDEQAAALAWQAKARG